MNPFQHFLNLHHIDPLRLSLAAGVRYMTIWNALHGIAITEEHATNIRVALHRLTGISYTGPLYTVTDQPLADQPTCPMSLWRKG